jgi:mercuric ion binding protein
MRSLLSAGVATAILFAPLAAHAAPKTVTLQVDNMTCATCGPTVKKSLARVAGVSDVVVSVEKGTATVTFEDTQATVEALVAATTNAGYPSRLGR